MSTPLAHAGDEAMARLATEAVAVCDASVGIVSLLESGEERSVACAALGPEGADSSVSLCAYAIREPDALVVEDLSLDARFKGLPPVAGPPFLRFYAGVPLFDRGGLPVGSLCVTHLEPRELSSKRLLALKHLASLASSVREIRLLFAQAPRRSGPMGGARTDQARLDSILLKMLEPRPNWS